MSTVISVEHLSKTYLLGQVGAPSESTRPFAAPRMLREGELPAPSRATWKPGGRKCAAPAANPMLRIGEKDHGNRDGLAGEELWALRDVSFTVEKGEALGIPSIALTSSRCLSGGQASGAMARARVPCSRYSRA